MSSKTNQGPSKSKKNPAPRDTATHRQRAGFVSEQVPLYYQLATVLRDNILTGLFPSGSQLPTEAEIVERYGVSRITVRQALRLLVSEGLIRREVGRGTFVTDALPKPPMLRMDVTIDDLITLGSATSVELVDYRMISLPAIDAEALGIERGSQALRVTRLRYYYDEPYSLIINVLPEEIGKRLTKAYLKKGSILSFLEEKLGIHLHEAQQSVRATLADATTAGMLHTAIGAPLLFSTRVVRSDKNEPVELVRTYYRGEIYSLEFYMQRHRAQKVKQNWSIQEAKSVRRTRKKRTTKKKGS